jgi:hypothetical protein
VVNMSEHICVLRLSPALPVVWVFWRLIWRTESLDRGLILVCRFFLSAVGVHSSCGSDLPLFTRLNARA